ncbi:MAG: hypothetical protein AAB887_00960 [Patescibacteria group bacterium]
MKKTLAILAVLVLVAVLVWMKVGRKTPTVNTPVTTGEDLNKELMATEDDGGAADFVELQNSAEGL